MQTATTIEACLTGLVQVFSVPSLLFLSAGVLIGGVVGILPGLGGAATVALLLPFVFEYPAHQAFALLIGLVSVTATTGDLTSILVGIPGEATAAATVVDGHPMARRGEAGRAMGASLVSSLAGSLFGAVTLGIGISAARPLSLMLGSPELFMLAVLGICFAVPLTSASRLRGLAAGALGLVLATVGLDPIGAMPRFTLGQLALWDGVGLIPVALGLFAIPEIVSLAGRQSIAPVSAASGQIRFIDGIRDAGRRWSVVLRSSAIGTAVGLLPGVGASVSQWIAYAHAAKRSPNPAEFGHGAIDGVIAPSAANNSTLGGALVPTLALGIPGSLSAAMLLSALIVKGLVPGPQMLMPERDGGHLAFVYSLAWLIVVANVVATALSWGASGLLIKVTRIKSALLVPILLLLVFVGAFTERNLVEDLLITVVVGAAGLAFTHFRWPRAPLLIGLVLGPLAENRLFLSIDAYGASWLLRPGVLVIGTVIATSFLYPVIRRSLQRELVETRKDPADAHGTHGERAMVAALLVLLLFALMSTAGFTSRAALFPRMVLAVSIALLAALLIRDVVRGFDHTLMILPGRERASSRTVGFVPVFLVLIWALGFTYGATLAVLTYLVIVERERIGTALGIALIAYLLLEIVMVRLLHVPFPSGAVRAWAAVAHIP